MRYRRAATTAVSSVFAVLVLGVAPPAAAAPPANDAFSAAVELGPLPDQHSVNTARATLQAGEPQPPCGFGAVDSTVWYSFTRGADVFATVDTLGSSYDTVVAVWAGTTLPDLEMIGCGDDALTVAATVAFRARAHVTYYIQVGGLLGEGGSLVVRMRELEAGMIEGRVTDEANSQPLARTCVFTFDRDIFSFQGVVTQADGTYEAVVRRGSHLVLFLDHCDRSDDFVGEWYDDVPAHDALNATAVDVTEGVSVPGIDAALPRGCPGWASTFALGGYEQIRGTAGPDELTGTSADDVLCGLGGDDTLSGLLGDDGLIGGPGNDELDGGADHDWVEGDGGADRLLGRSGHDALAGHRGRDLLAGGVGNDFLDGGPQEDRCLGGTGVDEAARCELVRSARTLRFGGPAAPSSDMARAPAQRYRDAMAAVLEELR